MPNESLRNTGPTSGDGTMFARFRQSHRLTGPAISLLAASPVKTSATPDAEPVSTAERSGLWSEFARIVRVVRPRYVLVENVPALTLRGLSRVLGDLAALGFDAEWDCIPAAAVGAPHLRWRIFILAYSQSMQRPSIEWGEPDGVSGLLAANADGFGQDPRRSDRSDVSNHVPDANGQRQGKFTEKIHARQPEPCGSRSEDIPVPESRWAGQRWRGEFAAYCESQRHLYWPDAEPPVCGVADGVPNRVHRLRGLGNAVVPQVAEFIGRQLLRVLQE